MKINFQLPNCISQVRNSFSDKETSLVKKVATAVSVAIGFLSAALAISSLAAPTAVASLAGRVGLRLGAPKVLAAVSAAVSVVAHFAVYKLSAKATEAPAPKVEAPKVETPAATIVDSVEEIIEASVAINKAIHQIPVHQAPAH